MLSAASSATRRLWNSITIPVSFGRIGRVLPLLLWIFIAAAGCSDRLHFQEMPLGLKPDTELVADTGKREKLADSLKAVNLLFFGFTRCPDFCPMTLYKIKSAVEGDTALQNKLSLLFISVDGQNEKPADLKSYLQVFPYARGFTGSREEIAAVEKTFGAYSKDEQGKLSHSLYLYLLNKEGKVIYLLRHDDPVKKLKQALKQAEQI